MPSGPSSIESSFISLNVLWCLSTNNPFIDEMSMSINNGEKSRFCGANQKLLWLRGEKTIENNIQSSIFSAHRKKAGHWSLNDSIGCHVRLLFRERLVEIESNRLSLCPKNVYFQLMTQSDRECWERCDDNDATHLRLTLHRVRGMEATKEQLQNAVNDWDMLSIGVEGIHPVR